MPIKTAYVGRHLLTELVANTYIPADVEVPKDRERIQVRSCLAAVWPAVEGEAQLNFCKHDLCLSVCQCMSLRLLTQTFMLLCHVCQLLDVLAINFGRLLIRT